MYKEVLQVVDYYLPTLYRYIYKEAYAKATQDSIAEHFTCKWGTPIARRTVGNTLQKKADWTTVEVHQLKVK